MFSLSRRAALAAALVLFVLVGSAAGESGQSASSKSAPWTSDGAGTPPAFDSSRTRSTFAAGAQHGPVSNHLPSVRENV